MRKHKFTSVPPEKCDECGSEHVVLFQTVYYFCMSCKTLLGEIPPQNSTDRLSEKNSSQLPEFNFGEQSLSE